MSIWNPYAFNVFGDPLPPAAPPALRVYGGEATAGQLSSAQGVFAVFSEGTRMSYVPNPTEIGRLADGTPYRITVVGNTATMEVWLAASLSESDEGISPGIRFNKVRDGATTTFIVLSPPPSGNGEWRRTTIVTNVDDVAPNSYPATGAPIKYADFVLSYAAPTPAGYFYKATEPKEIGGVTVQATVQLGGLVSIPHAAPAANYSISFGKNSSMLAGTQWGSGTTQMTFLRARPGGAAVPLGGTGSALRHSRGKPWGAKILPPLVVPQLDEELWHYDIPSGATSLFPRVVSSFEGFREFVHCDTRLLLSTGMDSPFAGQRWFQLPYQTIFMPYPARVEVHGGLLWYALTGNAPELLRDTEDRILGLTVDVLSDSVIAAEDIASSYQSPAPPFQEVWSSPLGGTPGVRSPFYLGCGMLCSASSPVPTYSWGVAATGPGKYRISTAATMSGPTSFHGISNFGWKRYLAPAFVGREVVKTLVSDDHMYEITSSGAKSYSASGHSDVSTGTAPVRPDVPNIYTAPLAGGGGGVDYSFSGSTELKHTDHSRSEFGEFGELYLTKHSLLETTAEWGSYASTTGGSFAADGGTTVAQTWHFEERFVYVFDPELRLLCYSELIYDGTHNYSRAHDGKYSARPMPSPSSMPDLVFVIRHGGQTIRLSSRPVYSSEEERRTMLASYMPSAGLPPGFEGGDIAFFVSRTANGGMWKTADREVAVLTPTPFGFVLNDRPMDWIPLCVTTDVKTGQQPSGTFLAQYSMRGKFSSGNLGGLKVRYIRSPDGKGALLHIAHRDEYPELDFGTKTFCVTKEEIREMPEAKSADLDFNNMAPF